MSFRYNQLDSFTDVGMSNSTSALRGRSAGSSSFLGFQNTNYRILENIKSGIGEWNWVIGNSMANSFQSGYTYQDESRQPQGTIFPFVEIFEGGTSYTAFGFEPFSYNNELRYKTFQIQDNFTKFSNSHSLTFGMYAEKYHSENIFFSCCPQSAYSYNSLADFYADANGFLANPNRTVSPITLGAVPGALQQHPRQRQGDTAARRVVLRRLRAGRVAAGWQRHRDGGRPIRRRQLQGNVVCQPGGRRADVPRRRRPAGAVPDRPDARAEVAVVAAHRHQLGRGGQPADSGPRRHRRLHR